MKKIKLIADSSCDVLTMEGVDFAIAPLTISTQEKSFVDDASLDVVKMLEYLAAYKGRSFSACPNVEDWLAAYAGAEEIYVVTLSSGVSGTYAAANTAAKLYQEEHPQANIHVFDTLSAGPEVRMLADKLAAYIKAGKSFEEICALGEEAIKKTRIFFALQSFHNFAENGRVNKTVAHLGSLLGIRVMATASQEGTIEITDKCRGEKGMLKRFMERMEEAGYQGGNVYLAHCLAEDVAEKIKESITQKYPAASICIYPTRGLCSFYAEKGGVLLGFEIE